MEEQKGRWDAAYAAIRREAETNTKEVAVMAQAIVALLETQGIELTMTVAAGMYAAALGGAQVVLAQTTPTQQVSETPPS